MTPPDQVPHPLPPADPPRLVDLRIPKVVRVYAVIIIIVNVLELGIKVPDYLVILATTTPWSWAMWGPDVYWEFLQLGFGVLWLLVGLGLWSGRRVAVYIIAFVVLCLPMLGAAFLYFRLPVQVLVIFASFAAVQLPILVSAFGRWKAFK